MTRSSLRRSLIHLLSVSLIAMVAILSGISPVAKAASTVTSNALMVGMAATPTGNGYWEVASDGGIFTFGDARFYGSMGGKPLNAPIVGMAAMPSGNGYWLVASDGGIFAFGDASFSGSMGGQPLNTPIVGIAATRDGNGYWLIAKDGGIFAFGNAGFYGSMGGKPLNAPIVGMASTLSSQGYWLVAADGGIFTFGDAGFYGSMGGKPLSALIVGMARTGTGQGYWLVAADGGIFTFGDASFYGSMGDKSLNAPVVGISALPSGQGYWLVARDGGIFAFGNAGYFGSATVSTPTPTGGSLAQVVAIANDIKNGQPKPGWSGGPVPYSWGGGHGTTPGPSFGTCSSYTGFIQPCPATTTRGVDCSGFVRWVYALAFGADVLGAGNTNMQITRLHKVSTPQPGDLVYYGKSTSNTHHVGIYIGNGQMINALRTGTNVRVDNVTVMSDRLGYFHYTP